MPKEFSGNCGGHAEYVFKPEESMTLDPAGKEAKS